MNNSVVIIPARGGSKGIPGKNHKVLGGKPLIHHTIDAAREVFEESQIIVSTDDLKIKECAEQTGLKVPFLRPASLATDSAGTYEVLLHAVQYVAENLFEPETLVLLQPTSPFRSKTHIKEALKIYNGSTELDMVVSVVETKSNPYYVLFEENSEGFLEQSKKGRFKRRQDCPKVWEYNGAIYIMNVKSLKQENFSNFKRIKKYVMDEESSLDLDSPLDWMLAELIFQKRKEKQVNR